MHSCGVKGCDAHVQHAADPEVKVFEYNSGGAFGELALLHGEPRLATVRCTVCMLTMAGISFYLLATLICLFTCLFT